MSQKGKSGKGTKGAGGGKHAPKGGRQEGGFSAHGGPKRVNQAAKPGKQGARSQGAKPQPVAGKSSQASSEFRRDDAPRPAKPAHGRGIEPRALRPAEKVDFSPPSKDFQRLYGKHPVREALGSDRPVYKLWLSQTLTPHVQREFQLMAKDRDVPVLIVPQQKLDALLAHLPEVGPHQGVVAETGAYDYADWDEWLKGLAAHKEAGKDPFVLVLDQVQDSHNLGAILRTAEAAGAHGIVIPKHGGVGLSETVAKSSAGAIETMPVLQVTNLARSLEELKEAGLWIMGLSANGGASHFETNLKGPICLVIGGEHKGLRPNVESHCDTLLHIPMQSTRSLNASVAAAIAMYEVVRQRRVSTP